MKTTNGANKDTYVNLNIGPEDMPEFTKHLRNVASKSMGNPLSRMNENTLVEFDSKVFNNRFCFITTDSGNMLKLTKWYPIQQSAQYVIWIHAADVDKLLLAIKTVLSAGKAYTG